MLRVSSKQSVLFVAFTIVASHAVAADAPVLTCMGTRGPGAPAVILEAGAGNGIETWAKVQSAVAEFARVCAYSRPGLRRYWKDGEPPAAPAPDTVVDTLERALTNAGERPPYVLVGHSYGGMIVRLFAEQYPDRIRGVVLIDSSHEDQMRRFGDPPPVTPPPGASGVVVNLPEAIDLVAMSDALKMRTWRTTAPLLVLTRGNAGAANPPTPPAADAVARYQIWLELQRELATRSTVAEHVIAKHSGHYIQNDEPQLVIDGIRRMVESKAAQAGQPAGNVPTFEDVMVAPNDSHENGVFFNYIRGHLFVKNSTLRMLIRSAYGVQDSELVGGPEWMNVDRFNIEAKGDVGTSPALQVAHGGDPSRLQLMMQSLLADHFKLIVHRESREAGVYALTLLNADRRLGPSLRHSDIDCLLLAAQARQGNSRTTTQTSRCDLLRDVGSLTIGGRPLSQLANSLSAILGKTVVDQTGLTGNFDVRLGWTPDRTSPPTSLFVAIREQLGLDLVLGDRPAQVLVVDRADRPGDR